jgi:hypothetical protein
MLPEQLRPAEIRESVTAPLTGRELFQGAEVLRKENDPRLVSIMQRLTAVLEKRLPQAYGPQEDEKTEERAKQLRDDYLHSFRYVEQVQGEDGTSRPFNRILIVGPTWPGLGVSNEAISISTYNEDDGAILDHTVFMAVEEDMKNVADSQNVSETLEHTSLAVIHFPAVELGNREKVDIVNPHGYGFINGKIPIVDLARLLQMNIAIQGRKGPLYSGNLRYEKPFDVLSHAEYIVGLLEQESTVAIDEDQNEGPAQMDFEFKDRPWDREEVQ